MQFGSDIEDWDHYIHGTWWGYGTEEYDQTDSLVYEWRTNPATGTWEPNFSDPPIWSGVDWQAPPCIGTVKVFLDVNDVPDQAGGACPGDGNRNDTEVTFSTSINVVLPTGCRQGQASVEFVLNEIVPSRYCGTGDPWCGYTTPVEPPTDGYIDAVYHNCTWVFDIYMTWDVETGACSQVPDISSGDDGDLTEDNYCAIVDSMKNEAGCVCIGPQKYTSHECAGIHEAYHMSVFQDRIEEQEDLVLGGLPTIDINCNDSSTTTCQAVEAEYMDSLQSDCEAAMVRAYNLMHSYSETQAIQAAKQCFEDLAGEICTHAQSHNWEACSACQ